MTLFKNIFAARCPQCDAKLRYTGWELPYPQYICQHCTNVEEMNMDISIMHKKRVRATEEEQLAFTNFIRRRRKKQQESNKITDVKGVVASDFNDLYICSNFTTKSTICDRCRCNIWHQKDRIVSFENYRDCYEPTIFEIKLITPL